MAANTTGTEYMGNTRQTWANFNLNRAILEPSFWSHLSFQSWCIWFFVLTVFVTRRLTTLDTINCKALGRRAVNKKNDSLILSYTNPVQQLRARAWKKSPVLMPLSVRKALESCPHSALSSKLVKTELTSQLKIKHPTLKNFTSQAQCSLRGRNHLSISHYNTVLSRDCLCACMWAWCLCMCTWIHACVSRKCAHLCVYMGRPEANVRSSCSSLHIIFWVRFSRWPWVCCEVRLTVQKARDPLTSLPTWPWGYKPLSLWCHYVMII